MKKAFFIGLFASLALLTLYFFVMLLFTRDLSVALSQLLSLWPWFTLLITGFGLQIGLFQFLHFSRPPALIASSNTGLSSLTMVACCAHHVTDLAPLLGLTALSLFLSRYQVWFLAAGILANWLAIVYFIHLIKRNAA